MILDILAVLHQLVVHPLDQIGPPVTQGVQPLDHVDHQMEPVDIVEDPHVEGRGDGALLLVATDVKMLVVPAVGQLMNQRGVSVVGEDDGPVLGEEHIVLHVREAVGMLGSSALAAPSAGSSPPPASPEWACRRSRP